MTGAEEDHWLVPLGGFPAPVTLVCVPYAGAGPSVFHPLASALPEANVVAVRLPGRGRRIREPLVTSIAELAGRLAPVLAALDGPYVLYGHSMGGLLAFELARLARGSGPAHLVVSACGAPDEIGTGRSRSRHELPDDELVAEMIALGAAPEPLAVPEIRALALPVLRADLQAVEDFAYLPGSPLRCAITAIAGADDPEAPAERMVGWSRETTGPFRFETLDGGHFLFDERSAAVAGVLGETLSLVESQARPVTAPKAPARRCHRE